MENQSKIYVTRQGYNEYIEALASAEEKYAEVLKSRPNYGQNASDNYRSNVYDSEVRVYRNTVSSLKDTIARLVVIEKEDSQESVVGLGEIVTVMSEDGEVRQFKLTGGMPRLDVNAEVLEITINSPMGKAIYKSRVGDTVSYSVNKNNFSATILSKESAKEQSPKESQPE